MADRRRDRVTLAVRGGPDLVRRTLSSGAQRFELERVAAAPRLPERDRREAARTIARLFGEIHNRASIRSFVAEADPGARVDHLEDETVVRVAARILAEGRALLRAQGSIALRGSPGAPPEEEAPPPASARAPQAALTWIEIRLIGEDDAPIPGQRYRIELPDGSVREGTLDGEGLARVAEIDPGSCQVTFPDLDSEAWTRA
jgi:hypothetical protein